MLKSVCFIILTLVNNNEPIIVNTENIVAINKDGDNAEISVIMGNWSRYTVEEDIGVVQQKIERCDVVEVVF